MKYHTYTEIIDQAVTWEKTIGALQQQVDALNALPQSATIFTGCGSPHYLSYTAAAAYRELTGRPAYFHPASEIWLYPESTLAGMDETTLFVVSRSGETTEVLRAVEVFQEQVGNTVLGVTCYPEAPLAKDLKPMLVAQDSQEIGLAQTRSFSNMLLLTLSYCYAAAGRDLSEGFKALPRHAASVISKNQSLIETIGSDTSIEQYYFLGSHANYGIASEGMLKMKEMSLSYAEGYHFMEFRHGPMSMVNDKTLIIGLVSRRSAAKELAVLREMQKMGARILAVVPGEVGGGEFNATVTLPPDLSDIERVPLHLPVIQMLAYYRTLAKGLNPDTPANLNMVVHLDA
ncbi:MAG: SIS domain-containing protein [Chloroflexota bacterium]